MTAEISATYVNGVFQPDTTPELPDRTRVKISYKSVLSDYHPTPCLESLAKYIEFVKKIPVRGAFPKFTREELYERD